MMESRRGFNSITRGDDFTEDQQHWLFNAARQVGVNPLAEYLDLDREASVALYRHGNTRVAAIMAAAASEVMLDRTLLLLQWEEKLTPEESVESWRDALKSRVEKDFNVRIGGSWDTTADGPVGRWSQKVADVRHRAVHGGYRPTREEAEEAIRVSRELVTYIGDRITAQENFRKYRRSAMLLLGNEGLISRERYTRAARDMQNDPNESWWPLTFGSWYKAWVRLRSDSYSKRVSSLQGASLLAVYIPGEPPKYVAHDGRTGQAALVSLPASEASERIRSMVAEEFSKHAASGAAENAISIGFEGGVFDGVELIGPWVEEYHFLPLRGVMVDRSDFTVPIR
jgi:hypothetical protein